MKKPIASSIALDASHGSYSHTFIDTLFVETISNFLNKTKTTSPE